MMHATCYAIRKRFFSKSGFEISTKYKKNVYFFFFSLAFRSEIIKITKVILQFITLHSSLTPFLSGDSAGGCLCLPELIPLPVEINNWCSAGAGLIQNSIMPVLVVVPVQVSVCLLVLVLTGAVLVGVELLQALWGIILIAFFLSIILEKRYGPNCRVLSSCIYHKFQLRKDNSGRYTQI